MDAKTEENTQAYYTTYTNGHNNQSLMSGAYKNTT